MKVVIISFVEPSLRDNGKKIVLDGLVQFFLQQPNVQLEYFLLTPEQEMQSGYHSVTVKKFFFSRSWWQIIKSLWWSIILGKAPFQQSVLFNVHLRTSLRRALCQTQPDLVIYDTVRVAQFFKTAQSLLPKARHVLFFDDLFTVRYQKMLKVITRYPGIRLNPLGNFKNNVPALCQRLLQARWLCRWLLKHEIKQLIPVERQAAQQFNLGLLVSSTEVEHLREQSGQNNIAPLPVYFPESTKQNNTRRMIDAKKPIFIFLGDFRLAHNAFSIQYFIEHHMAECLKMMPDMTLHLIGKYPSEAVQNSAKPYGDHIHFSGFIDDLSVPFSQCQAMIVPLLFGSGIKIKTLEAMRFGIPVISTDFGVEGIINIEQSSVVIENNLAQFPRHMHPLSAMEGQRPRRIVPGRRG